jgi:hypothetical protein
MSYGPLMAGVNVSFFLPVLPDRRTRAAGGRAQSLPVSARNNLINAALPARLPHQEGLPRTNLGLEDEKLQQSTPCELMIAGGARWV